MMIPSILINTDDVGFIAFASPAQVCVSVDFDRYHIIASVSFVLYRQVQPIVAVSQRVPHTASSPACPTPTALPVASTSSSLRRLYLALRLS